VLFAPKLLVTGDLTPKAFDDPDGSFGTSSIPYRSLGAAIHPGGKVTTTLQFTNFNADDTLALSFDVRDNDVLIAGHWDDTVGSVSDESVEAEVGTFYGASSFMNNPEAHGGGVTPDGRWIAGSRNSGVIGSYDVATGARVLSHSLAPGKHSVRRLILDPSGSAGYALLGAGHSYGATREGKGGGTPSWLVTFDTATLREAGRLDIGASRNRTLVMSPDGRWLAIATGIAESGVIIVDLATLRVARRLLDDPAASASGVAFSPDGTKLAVASQAQINVYNLADGTRAQSLALPPPSSNKTYDCLYGPDGRVWFGRESDLVAADLTTGTVETFSQDSSILFASGTKIYAADNGDNLVQRFATDGTNETSLPFETSIYSHTVCRSPF
jgi:WD40 repeat protein